MLNSADLTPVSTSLNPNQKHPSNVAGQHQIFECHWDQPSQTLSLYRIRNHLDRSKVFVASSTSQIDQQLKAIRTMHGKPNPSKALLLRLSVP